MRRLLLEAIKGLLILLIITVANFPIRLWAVTAEDEQAAIAGFQRLPEANDLNLDQPENPPNLKEADKNSILIELREGSEPNTVLRQAGLNPLKIEEVFCSLPAEGVEITNLNKDESLQKDSERWYWFLGKNYKENQKIPQEIFFLHYKITFPQNISLAEVIDRLQGNPSIEYVMPAYLFTGAR